MGHAGNHIVAASGMSVVACRHGPEYRDTVSKPRDSRHQLSYMKPRYRGGYAAKMAPNFTRRIRLGIPGLVLGRSSELVEKDAGPGASPALAGFFHAPSLRSGSPPGQQRRERETESANAPHSKTANTQPLTTRQAITELQSIVVNRKHK